jgi:hypothetical protein
MERRQHGPQPATAQRKLEAPHGREDRAVEARAHALGNLAAVALNFGADDMDGTVGYERIAHDAGATSPMQLQKEKIVSIIHEAGKIPVERDVWYNPLHIYTAEGTTIVSKMPYLNSVPFYAEFEPSSGDVKVVPLVPNVLGEFAKEGKVDAGPMSGGIDGDRGELEWDRAAHGPSVPDLYSRLKCSQ